MRKISKDLRNFPNKILSIILSIKCVYKIF